MMHHDGDPGREASDIKSAKEKVAKQKKKKILWLKVVRWKTIFLLCCVDDAVAGRMRRNVEL